MTIPYHPTPFAEPPKPRPPKVKAKPEPTPIVVAVYRACDRCGYSKIDDQPIARATHQFETERGSLYLCGHHFREHSEKILFKGYPVREVA